MGNTTLRLLFAYASLMSCALNHGTFAASTHALATSRVSVSGDERLYVLECLGPKDDSWFDRKEKCDWRVHSIGVDGSEYVYLIHDQIRNYNLMQPIPDGLLLAGSRCQFASTETAPNAHGFDFGGEPLRSVLLGDGIQNMQSTATGDIWVAYFDEGVFGNLGWKHPIGSSGLIRFDAQGNQGYKFEPKLGLDMIVDCYAFNYQHERGLVLLLDPILSRANC
jgi:hypothetical protein